MSIFIDELLHHCSSLCVDIIIRIYAFLFNSCFFIINSCYIIKRSHRSFITIAIVALVLSIIGQLGDFAASTIKRQFDIKDFSEIFPGHGGMIDRIDSVMFAAPYAYFIFAILLV